MSKAREFFHAVGARLGGKNLAPGVRRPLIARALILGVVLCGIKVAMMLDLHSHLYQTHYRLSSNLPHWMLVTDAILFLVILMTCFVELGRQAPAYAKRDIRWCNLWFVLAGLLFVFLNLHQGAVNYIQPVLDGTLKIKAIGWYLATDSCFNPPWLAAYILLYPAIYWLLAAKQRESWSFYFLGAIAVLYLILNLQFSMQLGREILLINCFGIGALASLRFSRSIPSLRSLMPPLLLGAAGWVLFATYNPDVARPEVCFVLILSLSVALWACIYVLTRRSTIFPILGHFLPFFLVAFTLLSLVNFPLAENYDHLLVYGISLPHYIWQEIAGPVLLLAFCFWLARGSSLGAMLLFDVTALLLIIITAADLELSRRMGFRLDWSAVTVSNDPVMLWRTIKPFVANIAPALVCLVFAYYVGVAVMRWVYSRIVAGDHPLHLNRADATFLVTTFALVVCASPWLLLKTDKAAGTWVSNIITSHPLFQGQQFKRYSPAELSKMAAELNIRGIPPAPPASTAGPERKLNVLLIVMESSYNRYLSLFGARDETEPLLKKYQDRLELFPNFYSMFPNSFHGRFSVLSGLYPTRQYVSYINPRIECPSLFEILHDHGWKVSVFDSCYGDYARLNDYMRVRKIDTAYDANTMPTRDHHPKVSWGVAEAATMEAITNQITQSVRTGERFFITYTPVAPHMPYDSPARQFVKFEESNRLKGDYSGRYKNQLLYMDWIITSIIDSLAENQVLDNTLVFITNDHGEMVGDGDGQLGHGWNLRPELVNTPLIIMNPLEKGYRVNPTLGGQIDVLPTMLELLNIPLPEGHLYEGVSLYDAAASANKVLYFNSYQHRAMVTGDKYFLKPPDTAATVYDVGHDGVKTLFTPTEETTNIEPRLKLFEEFQNSFIVNYSYYRKSFGTAPAAH